MCLTVNRQISAPTKRFCVWKVLQITDKGQLQTPNRDFPVSVGLLCPDQSLTRAVSQGARLDGGVIHAHQTRKRAIRSLDDNSIVVRCHVSPLEFVAFGRHGDIAVSCLRITQNEVAKGLDELPARIRKNRDMQLKSIRQESRDNLRRFAKAKRKLK